MREQIETKQVGDCLVVTNRKVNRAGYIYLRVDRKGIAYHRWLWEQKFGPLLDTDRIKHTCGNNNCVNFDHLKLEHHSSEPQYFINENGCHICTSHKSGRHGYPLGRDKVFSSGTTENLHRIIYKRKYGAISSDVVIRHKCDNRLCINIEHLEPGTLQENMEDRNKRGRVPRGENHFRAKLNADSIQNIRRLLADGMEQKDIATMYNVQQTAISAIKTGKTWSHI